MGVLIVMKGVLVFVLAVAVAGCGDAAQKPYQKGAEAEEAGQLEDARSHYQHAVDANPGSRYGARAKVRLEAVEHKLAAMEKWKAKKAKQAETARKAEEADCKSGKWTFFCEGGGGLLTKDSKAECQKDRKGFIEGFKTRCAPCKCADGVPGAH